MPEPQRGTRVAGRSGDAGCVLAVDVGGTSMKGAVVAADYAVLDRERRPTPVADGVDAVVAAIVDCARALAARAVPTGRTPRAVGLAVPGVVDDLSGVARFAANIGWDELPLAALVEQRSGLPVALGHDVRAGGLAEVRLGAARGRRDVLVLPLGTGIAAACVVDGRLLIGGGYAGEAGHLQVDPDGEPCPCGSRGCLERVASAAAVCRRYAARTGREVGGADEVAAAVRAGDADARAVWDDALAALTDVIVQCVTLLGSEAVVLGGGLAQAEDLLVEPLARAVGGRLTFQRRPEFLRATLGDEAGSLGAALYAWDMLSSQEIAARSTVSEGIAR